MTVIVILICPLCIFLILGTFSERQAGISELLMQTAILFSVAIVFITEITSVFNILGFQPIFIFWSILALLCIAVLFVRKASLILFLHTIRKQVSIGFHALGKPERIFFYLITTLLVLILLQGLVYAPNNWDAMVYHLARIPHWISNHSVAHFPTHIYRQIYQPPFAEYFMLHLNLLSTADYLSNSVQFFFLFFSIPATISLTDIIGLAPKYRIYAFALLVTIPEVILQASSTQNDLVLSYFILAATYYCLQCIRQDKFQNYIFLGLSSGLGLLTKGTAYLFLAPVLVLFAVIIVRRTIKIRRSAPLFYACLAMLICIAINAGVYLRNYSFSKNILGLDSVESKKYANERMSPAIFLSSVIKNAGVHMGPYPINKLSYLVIRKLHQFAGIDIDDPAFNFGRQLYSGALNITTNENITSNFIPFYLIVLSLVVVGIHALKKDLRANRFLIFLIIILTLQTILYCFYLKWQPWCTRLQTPLFMLAVPFICFAASLRKIYTNFLLLAISVSIAYGYFLVLCNDTRPFWTNRYTVQIRINDNWFKKYFADRLNEYAEYDSVQKNINQSNYKNIGLILGENDYEYPLFSQVYKKAMNPVEIDVTDNVSRNIPQKADNIDCIVSTVRNDSLISFKGKDYFNQDRKNSFIWLYTSKISPGNTARASQ